MDIFELVKIAEAKVEEPELFFNEEVQTLVAFLRSILSDCVSISDNSVASTMRLFANGHTVQDIDGSNKSIEAGECSTSGLTALLAICKNEPRKQNFGLDKKDKFVCLLCRDPAYVNSLYNNTYD